MSMGVFNARTHEGVRQLHRKLAVESEASFNPRTHEGCDSWIGGNATEMRVSIHAPTRGATSLAYTEHQEGLVSIHAPTRGATTCSAEPNSCLLSFQSTHPRGVRRINPLCLCQFQSTHPRGVRLAFEQGLFAADSVSIHAPTRGATGYPQLTLFSCQSFNPRTHEGCDKGLLDSVKKRGGFQSTHPRGVRLADIAEYFESQLVSIHAPTRGATSLDVMWPQITMFQSTHPRGVRRLIYF